MVSYSIRSVDYFYATILEEAGAGYRLLPMLAELGVDLVAMAAVPLGPARTQLTLFPADSGRLRQAAQRANITLEGPHRALLVQGDDEMGALAEVYEVLSQAGVGVFAASAVGGGQGRYGCVLYVRDEDCDRAVAALGL
jgi:hypothetical protein